MKTLLALCLFMPMTMSSVVASEKTDEKISFGLKLNDQGQWCGKFYSNRWSNNMRYQCKTQAQWEKLGVDFPEEMKMVDFETPIVDSATIRG